MQQAIGAVFALTLLLALIVGPVYLAVSADDGVDFGSGLCAAGDLACELGSTRPAGPSD